MTATLVAVAAALTVSASPAAVDASAFRYVRSLSARPGPTSFEPDGALFSHTRPGFADLRVVDADGRQVPWRRAPAASSARSQPLRVLNRGREGDEAVALLDLGPARRIHDSVELLVPDVSFVGRVTVLGGDDRRTLTRLSSTPIYSVRGARDARSTIAVFPATNYRYLLLRARGISTIEGALATYDPGRPRLEPVQARTTIRQQGRRTIVDLDLGFRNVPADALLVTTTTRRFDREAIVSASNDGAHFHPASAGRIARLSGVSLTTVPAGTRRRYLRIVVENGDDAPLRRLRIAPLSRPRTLIVAGGFRPPYRLLYGNPALREPEYDFRELPAAELDLGEARVGRLRPERLNAAYEPPEDTRSFAARHPTVLQGALVLAALTVVAGVCWA